MTKLESGIHSSRHQTFEHHGFYQTMAELVQDLKKIQSNTFQTAVPIEIPETKYANSNGVDIAYQVFGKGPLDIV